MKLLRILILSLAPVSIIAQQGNWEEQFSGVSTDLNVVFALDSLHVWAAGDNAIFIRSTDGGITWEIDTLAYTARCMYFFNAQNGIIAGGSSQVLLTEDGGLTWNNNSTGVSADFAGMTFLDSLNGWLIGNGNQVILKTCDGGHTWQDLSIGNNQRELISVDFSDSLTGWIAARELDTGGFDYSVLKTIDGGISWFSQFTFSSSWEIWIYKLYDLCAVDSQNLIIAGYGNDILNGYEGGVVYYSNNAGQDWDWRGDYLSWAFYSVCSPDPKHAWVTGSKRILFIDPVSDDLILQFDHPVEFFFNIHFADSLYGWAVGTNGAIVHTHTGGLVGLQDISTGQDPGIHLFPNPCTSSLNCQLSKFHENTDLLISDIHGRVVFEQHFGLSKDIVQINTSNLVSGVYILQLRSPERFLGSYKFIIR